MVRGGGVQAHMLEQHEDRHDSLRQDNGSQQATTFFEVTVASVDQPKLLSRLSEALVRVSCINAVVGPGKLMHAMCRGGNTMHACCTLIEGLAP